ncbi:hypothetical protein E4T38_06236 [Aureobasidium subglaciale]|nr:hypothetical protein E4T38_06236 [Aureobasidium subglaciale]KAI5219717.1 hypothetical protein E4T40_06306 [Aureobasidium subglaciale]KAI5223421.1 hypothetical protein E4T41_06146 [Aureobasidium subglaciale]KAI5260412.1 hypothetical protein E4T46_05991 [Aureobasidium subglaciale]
MLDRSREFPFSNMFICSPSVKSWMHVGKSKKEKEMRWQATFVHNALKVRCGWNTCTVTEDMKKMKEKGDRGDRGWGREGVVGEDGCRGLRGQNPHDTTKVSPSLSKKTSAIQGKGGSLKWSFLLFLCGWLSRL